MTKHEKIKYITLAAVLSALIVVLSFLPIKAFVEITLTIIPISIGIIIGGYKNGFNPRNNFWINKLCTMLWI